MVIYWVRTEGLVFWTWPYSQFTLVMIQSEHGILRDVTKGLAPVHGILHDVIKHPASVHITLIKCSASASEHGILGDATEGLASMHGILHDVTKGWASMHSILHDVTKGWASMHGILHDVTKGWASMDGILHDVTKGWASMHGILHDVTKGWVSMHSILHDVTKGWASMDGILHDVTKGWASMHGILHDVTKGWASVQDTGRKKAASQEPPGLQQMSWLIIQQPSNSSRPGFTSSWIIDQCDLPSQRGQCGGARRWSILSLGKRQCVLHTYTCVCTTPASLSGTFPEDVVNRCLEAGAPGAERFYMHYST